MLNNPMIDIREILKGYIFRERSQASDAHTPEIFYLVRSNNPHALTSRTLDYKIPPVLSGFPHLTQFKPEKVCLSSTASTSRSNSHASSASMESTQLRNERRGTASRMMAGKPSATPGRTPHTGPSSFSTEKAAKEHASDIIIQIPEGSLDFALWVRCGAFPWQPDDYKKWVFVTRTGETSPFLSIVFDDLSMSAQFPKEDHRVYVKNRLAVHCSAALYNRYLLRAKAAGFSHNAASDAKVEEDSGELFHFGISVCDYWYSMYITEMQGNPDQTPQWNGCKMHLIADGDVTNSKHLKLLSEKYSTVLEWCRVRYISGLKKDLKRCLRQKELIYGSWNQLCWNCGESLHISLCEWWEPCEGRLSG